MKPFSGLLKIPGLNSLPAVTLSPSLGLNQIGPFIIIIIIISIIIACCLDALLFSFVDERYPLSNHY